MYKHKYRMISSHFIQLRLTVSNCICNSAARRFDAQQVLTIAETMHARFCQLPHVSVIVSVICRQAMGTRDGGLLTFLRFTYF